MGIRIHQLSPAIANQIAAGEVIERPASVVKELLENSYDAGADTVTIEIGYGGLNQIKISDNGVGIVAEDLPLAVAAHATSKITKLDDLYAIESMGFRGEALASISSVAKVTISSKPDLQDNAMMLQIKGTEFSISPCARTKGTTIDVSNLFFNAPVRKRFLKTEQLEFQAIETVVKRFALSAPQIALTLKHNNKVVLTLPSAVNEQTKHTRMTKIFGSSFVKEAIFLDVECSSMRLHGWISGTNFQRSQNDKQWIYINHRMVKDKLLNHALKQAYEGLLHPGRFPACLLYFTIDNAEVDVNVHPTKHEVRFQQPRLVHDFFTSRLTEALHTCSSSSIHQEYELNFNSSKQDDIHESALQENMYDVSKHMIDKPKDSNDASISVYANHSKMRGAKYFCENHTPWVFLNNRYVILFLKQQAYIVDAIALQQVKLIHDLEQVSFPLDNRPLLVPIRYAIPLKLKNKAVELRQCLGQVGIKVECIDEVLLIRSVPIQIPYLDIRLFLDSISEFQIIDAKTLIESMCQSQVFDPALLSAEEQMELMQFVINADYQEIQQQPFCKALTLNDCRMLLNV